MENQPLEILFQQAVSLDLPSLNALCRSNRYLYEVLCANDEFWKDKFRYDFGDFPDHLEFRNFKELYQAYHNLWILGGPLSLVEYPIKTKQVATGVKHTVFIDVHNWVWVMGENNHGELGLGNRIGQAHPTRIGMQAQYVAAGRQSTIVIDLVGKVWACGSNNDLQLGLPEERDYLTLTSLNLYAKQISIGMGRHTLMIDSNDNVWAWGQNQWSQCTPSLYGEDLVPTPLHRSAKQVQAGMMYSLILDHAGQVWFWGYNGFMHLNNLPDQSPFTVIANNIVQIASGNGHILMIDVNNEVWSVGTNQYGQLGTGDFISRNVPVRIGMQAQQISAGGAHSMLIDMQGQVWVWGSNHGLTLSSQAVNKISTPTLIPELNAYQVSAGAYTSAFIATKLNR